MNGDVPASWLGPALGLVGEAQPFPWQRALLASFRSGQLPRALDIPTGLGKTATMAIWLIARAAQAPVPRRLVYVVDRRVVVDQATEVAEELRRFVDRTPAVKAALGLDGSLPISTLRGQFVDNRRWLEDPSAVGIVVGTVDMVGSRLLFEGYGTSRKMRPYHAALLGVDALLVLDEAHLVPPFEHLCTAVADGTPWWPQQPPVPRLRLLALSATGRSPADRAFGLTDADLADAVVHARMTAGKRLVRVALPKDVTLADAVAEHVWGLRSRAGAHRCLVFVNARRDAQAVADALVRRAKAEKVEARAPELLVGERRVRERGIAAATLRSLGFVAGSAAADDTSVLVATSAGEVGIDLDADHVVCDRVAWERMVQRLGRVNRRGKGAAEVIVVDAPAGDAEGAAARADAERLALDALPMDGADAGARDASPAAIRKTKSDPTLRAMLDAATTPEPLRPALTLPLIEAWAMTSLPEHTGRADVGPWLRGWVDDEVQTRILWRSQLDVARDADLLSLLEATPPHASEVLEAPTYRACDWFLRRVAAARRAGRIEDHDRVAVLIGADGKPDRRAVVRAGDLVDLDKRGKDKLFASLSGRTVAVSAALGGLDGGGLLSDDHDAPPITADGDGWTEPGAPEPLAPFRVRRVPAGDEGDSAPTGESGWSERLRVPLTVTAGEGTPRDWLVVERYREDAATEDDRSAGRPQLLTEHQAFAERHARALAARLGLDAAHTEMLAVAAALHDEGKAAQRWQRAFHAPKDGVYAKTRGPVHVSLLDGYRHELGSLPIAAAHPRLVRLPEPLRELALHLVAAHHGFARPVVPTSGCDDAPPSALTERAREVALRYANLQARYGPWGLAWWETVLRAADQLASRENDAGGRR